MSVRVGPGVPLSTLTCPPRTPNINPVMNNTQKLIKTLEAAGKSPHYIIGNLQAVLQLLERESPKNAEILADSVKYAEQLIQMNKEEEAKLNK